VANLPIGRVLDQIACWRIYLGEKEKTRPLGGSLYEQMQQIVR